MEIEQKRGSARTHYRFFDDRLEYSWKDSSGGRSFSVPYVDISRDRQTLSERNAWFRNAGLLWLILGAVRLAVTWRTGDGADGWFWLVLGGACVAYYYLRPVHYLILPSDKGNLLVLNDADGKRIVEEIEARRAASFREEYDFFPEDESPQKLRSRFNWLHREGALSDEQLQARLAEVELRERGSGFREPPSSLLN